MPENRMIITLTAPLPGWIRFQHVRTGRTLDFNPDYSEHQGLMPHFASNPDWENVTAQYDEPTSEAIEGE